MYRTDHHLAIAQGQTQQGRDPQAVVIAHVRRLEALRRAGIVERIAAETGLEHRPITGGQRVTGTYRRSITLASGRYAMLDDSMGFSLVPWKPVIEQRLGQQLAATVRSGMVNWELGRNVGR